DSTWRTSGARCDGAELAVLAALGGRHARPHLDEESVSRLPGEVVEDERQLLAATPQLRGLDPDLARHLLRAGRVGHRDVEGEAGQGLVARPLDQDVEDDALPAGPGVVLDHEALERRGVLAPPG